MDIEKANQRFASEVRSVDSSSASSLSIEGHPKSQSFFRNVVDGFKRADTEDVDTGDMTEEEIQGYLTSKAPLKRSLQSWQISLIAIGGSIGSGLFIGVGNSFKEGGVGAVVIGFSLMGVLIFCTMQSVGCLATAYPVNGSYIYYTGRFISKSLGCTLSWVYLEGWLMSVPLEMISSAITLSFWDSDNNPATKVNKVAWISLFYATVYTINLFGAVGYGWGEAILSIIKVIAVLGFCIFGIVAACGGYSGQYAASQLESQPDYLHGLTGKYIGAHFWYNPGSFVAGFKGVINTALNAAFSYGGSELAALAAAETKNPTRAIPKAMKQVFWRVCLFYIVSLTIVGCLVPYTDDRLGTTKNGKASPFVIAISNANVKALPSIFNTVICLAVLSVGNVGVFGASRTVASMGAQGFGPRRFGYIDRQGRPLVGIALSAAFGLLSFLAAYKDYGKVFNWMMAISGLASMFVWGSINLATFRLFMGMRAQNRSLEELTFKPLGGIVAPIVGMFLAAAVIVLEFWIALYPVGKSPSADGFFQTYMSVPIIVIIFGISKWYLKDTKWFVKASDMDLNTGLRASDPQILIQQNREEAQRVRSRGFFYRIYNFWC